ncbi:TetR/AcrR family transcriptional regulator [Simiduia aestuariiviva]|uniref:AcrR family transcriptional regulator n=1 Tax=Simiduia aestuariiviva TaxID=1510459 RepID=A0A839URM0_9GAMM|nr:TetR/AcrR family transcriptional regulator [Simiduia aestuariiviva]MBB3168516.1 AcrR family transcriptional regulator [Simiduia aestuariiviva]
MSQPDTVARILDAAEALFAERGFAETSLRTITSTAGVNLAAVNYHFGSKKELIQAVFARFLTPFCQELDRSLVKLVERKGSELLTPVDLLDCLFSTICDGSEEGSLAAQRFMRLLGLAYAQSQGHIRRFIIARYGEHYQRFTGLLQKAAPDIDPVTFYWRLYFMLGATIFTLSSFDSISAILKEDFGQDSTLAGTTQMMVPALSGMFAVK